jgi:uncharacterized protein YjbI with pentapeptide repeats
MSMKRTVGISSTLLQLISLLSSVGLAQNPVVRERQLIPAGRIIQMIEREERVLITHAIVLGKLELSEAKLDIAQYGPWYRKVVRSQIDFCDTEFQDEVDLSRAVFEKPVAFWKGPQNPHLEPLATTCRFRKGVSFFESKFGEGAAFTEVEFEGRVDFRNCEFVAVNFAGTVFGGDVNFESARFGGCHFKGARFDREVDFRSALFTEEAVFTQVHFNKGVDLRDAVFDQKADFTGATFETMKINWKQIRGVVREGTTGTPARKLVYDDQFYVFLIETFKKHGQFRDADSAYYDYRSRSRQLKKWYDPTRALEFILLDLSCGYGVKPFRALLFGLFVVLIFSRLYLQTGAIKERENPGAKPTLGDALYFSVNTFTTVGYGDWYPTAEFLRVGKTRLCTFRTIAMTEGILGWLILALFLVTLGRVWIR